jgi:hypothetical protein
MGSADVPLTVVDSVGAVHRMLAEKIFQRVYAP